MCRVAFCCEVLRCVALLFLVVAAKLSGQADARTVSIFRCQMCFCVVLPLRCVALCCVVFCCAVMRCVVSRCVLLRGFALRCVTISSGGSETVRPSGCADSFHFSLSNVLRCVAVALRCSSATKRNTTQRNATQHNATRNRLTKSHDENA